MPKLINLFFFISFLFSFQLDAVKVTLKRIEQNGCSYEGQALVELCERNGFKIEVDLLHSDFHGYGDRKPRRMTLEMKPLRHNNDISFELDEKALDFGRYYIMVNLYKDSGDDEEDFLYKAEIPLINIYDSLVVFIKIHNNGRYALEIKKN